MTDGSRTPRVRPALFLAVAIPLLFLVTAAVALQGFSGDDGETEIDAPPPGIPLAVFAEFGANADEVYVAPADDPAQRTHVATVDHAPGWGIHPGPAMHGATFAFTMLPPESAGHAGAPAEVWLMDIESGERTRLARDADLQVAPRFAAGGQVLLYRRSSGNQQELVKIDLESRSRHAVHAERTSFGIFPIGYASDGGLIYARLSQAGTHVLSVREGAAPETLIHASDDIARDWELSPDGRAIAYLAVEPVMESILHRAHVHQLASGEAVALDDVQRLPGEQYAPAWMGDGSSLAVGQQAQPDRPGAVVVQPIEGEAHTMPPPEAGFDVPIAWSPDGRFLAARSFTGVNSTAPGDESTVILDATGDRYPVAAQVEVIFIGWLPSA